MNIDRLETVWLTFAISGLIFRVLETLYFGWNKYPQSEAEFWCDFISASLSIFGSVIFVMWYGCYLYKGLNRKKI